MMLKFTTCLACLYLGLHLISASVNVSPKPRPILTFTAKVVGVKDGDTFMLLSNQKELTLRLSDVDCPEKRQPFGTAAKKFASDFCFGKTVQIRTANKKDRYHRLIGEIYFNGSCLNKELVRNGLAWQYVQYSKDIAYRKLEQAARLKKVGIWTEKHPVAPWEWRKQRKQASKRKKELRRSRALITD